MYATWWNPLTWYLPPDPANNPSSNIGGTAGTVGGGVNNPEAKPWPWWLDLMLISAAAVVISVAVKAAIDKKL